MQIDDLRKERLVYRDINKKLRKELQTKKVQMEKQLKESEELYIKKESLKKRLKESKEDCEKGNKE